MDCGIVCGIIWGPDSGMACGIVWGTVWCCGWILPIGGEIGTPGAWRGICAGGGEGFTGCIACFASKSISVVSITSPFKISGKELAANSENLLNKFLSDVKPKKTTIPNQSLPGREEVGHLQQACASCQKQGQTCRLRHPY